MADPIHLPIPLSHLFKISTSEARRHLAQGHVKLNDQVVEDLDVDLDQIPGEGPVTIELMHYEQKSLCKTLERPS